MNNNIPIEPLCCQGYNENDMSLEKINIIIADDHIEVREGTRELLQNEEDLNVIGEAGDGEEAVRLVQEFKPDIAILDVSMPRLNGIEATKKIKAISPSTEVIILTAYEYDQYVFPLLEAGASGYFLKDISSQELIKAVRRINIGEKVLHPVIARKAVNYFTRSTSRIQGRKGQTLTQREIEVLQLAARGQSNKQMAHKLQLSTRTVQAHLRNIFNKLEVNSRSEAVNAGLKSGLLILENIVDS